jgi:hypothetical protein
LHVLSTPPAFVLSQDQTLREEYFYREMPCLAGHRVHIHGGRHDG